MSPSAIFTVLILGLSTVHFSLTLSIQSPGDKNKLEERFVAKIVKDIISKVSHFSHHVIESNETVPTPDTISTNVNATDNSPQETASLSSKLESSNKTENETSDDAPAGFPFPFNFSDMSYEDDEDYQEAANEIPFSSLDPGSEYVLKVFSKLRKGNSMESATKELTAKLSSAHR